MSGMINRAIFVACAGAAAGTLLLVAGCSSKLETGYEPRTIGSNESERRGYYAAPFSKEAREARDRAALDSSDARRPRPGY